VAADVSFAARLAVRQPIFIASAVATLLIGITGITVMFSVVNAVLLRPLPYDNPDDIVRLVEHVPSHESMSGRSERIPSIRVEEFTQWRDATRTLADMGMYSSTPSTITGIPEPARLSTARISAAVFRILGAQPLIGRIFSDSEERAGADAVAVLSEHAWRRNLAADLTAVGRHIEVDGRQRTVVGVLRAGFAFPAPDTDLWIPFVLPEPLPGVITHASMIARLRRGAAIQAAASEANIIAARLRQWPLSVSHSNAPATRFEVIRVKDDILAPVRPALLMIASAMGLVLLISCWNVASLMLARGVARRREMTIRHAVGAGNGRLLGQVAIESLFIACVSGAAGIVLAIAAMPAVRTATVVNAPAWLAVGSGGILPRIQELSIDATVVLFTMSVSIGTSMIFGVIPVLNFVLVDAVRWYHAVPAPLQSVAPR
jgi:predicted permease